MCAFITHNGTSGGSEREFSAPIVRNAPAKPGKHAFARLQHVTSNESRWPRTVNPSARTVPPRKTPRSQRTSLARALLEHLHMAATVSTSRFAALSASASVVAEQLGALDDRYARDCHTRIMSIQPRLRAERFASARAMEMLTAAKAAARRDKATVKLLIDGAVRVGKIFDWADISAFAHQREATFFTMDGLAEALRARGAPGQALSARFTQAVVQSDAVKAELKRATAEYARATTAFTTEYRALAAAIAFGRAVLADLGVKVPRIADAKRGVSAHIASSCSLDDGQVAARRDLGVTATSEAHGAVTIEVEPLTAAARPPHGGPRSRDHFESTRHEPPSRVATFDDQPNGDATNFRDRPAYRVRPRGPAADRSSSSPTAHCATRTRTAACATTSSAPCRW